MTVKTVSEEYTPLHLAARFKPLETTTQESVENGKSESSESKMEGTTEADGSSGQLTRQDSSTMEYILSCKQADVSQYNSP